SIRVSIVSTRTGDDGTTSLGDKTRVAKDAARIVALGEVDELNSAIGLWRTHPLPPDTDALLDQIQQDLFDLGGELCIPGTQVMQASQVARLDQALKHYNATLPPLAEFILPGGCPAAAHAHVARRDCQRLRPALPEQALGPVFRSGACPEPRSRKPRRALARAAALASYGRTDQ